MIFNIVHYFVKKVNIIHFEKDKYESIIVSKSYIICLKANNIFEVLLWQ